jgi:type 1 glutamine amidotransferase
MKKIIPILTLCAVCAIILLQSLTVSPVRAAAPKRLLIVTTTAAFRHADVPIFERIFRDLGKSTGEFTIVSTTDSPDYPAAAYQAIVDQRNAQIPLSEAKDNDKPPAGGSGGARGAVPGATPAQQEAITAMNSSVAALTQAATAATAALNQTVYSGNSNAADIKAKADGVAAAELALANARLQELTKIQSSPAKLNPAQVQALAQTGARGGAGGRGGAPASPASEPLTPPQQTAVNAMTDSLRDLNQAVTAARTALNGAPFTADASAVALKAKADALGAATLALANANAAAFARIQASPEKLSAAQAQSVAQGGGGRGGRGGGGGGSDPTQAAVARILQQYMSPEALKNYDAVAFLSTTGELPIPDKDAFFRWIADGHAFIGVHAATDTLHQTPEYIKMIGGEFAGHGSWHPKTAIVNKDAKSPITAGWGNAIDINEELFLFRNYDPKQVHVLLAMDKQPYTGEPGEYPVSWIKMYGKGRVFYTSLGHRDDVLLPDATIGDQQFKVRYNQNNVPQAVQRHILSGIRWALGLVDSDVVPQAR